MSLEFDQGSKTPDLDTRTNLLASIYEGMGDPMRASFVRTAFDVTREPTAPPPEVREKPREKDEELTLAEERLSMVLTGIRNGQWSQNTREVLRTAFQRMMASGATPEQLDRIIAMLIKGVNETLAAEGSSNLLSSAKVIFKDGSCQYFVYIQGPNSTFEQNLDDIKVGRDSRTVLRLGSTPPDNPDTSKFA